MKRISLLIGLVALIAQAQSPSDIRFNEISVVRDSSGMAVEQWIELYNTSCTAIDMQGLYISNDLSNLCKYRVPQGTYETQFQPRGFAVIDADGKAYNGPLHTPFSLDESAMVYLVQANGRVILDSVAVPQNGSMHRASNGAGEWSAIELPTKGYSNEKSSGVGNVEKFQQVDPYGGGIALISMSVVFSVLILLAIAFSIIGKLFVKQTAKKESAAVESPSVEIVSKTDDDEELAVAVAVAIYKNEMHDSFNGKLTMVGKVNRLWKNTFLNTVINSRPRK